MVPFAFGIGGIPRTVFSVANECAARGHDVEIITLSRTKAEPPFDLHPDIRTTAVFDLYDDARPDRVRRRPRRNPKADPDRRALDKSPSTLTDDPHPAFSALVDHRLEEILSQQEDGIVVTTRPEFAVAAVRWTGPRVAVIHQEHLSITARGAALREGLRSVTAEDAPRRLGAFLTLTEAELDKWRPFLEPTPTRLDVLPNPTPFQVGEPSPLSAPVVLAAGRLEHQKGFDMLIEAWAPLAASHPDWRLDIYGEGKLEKDLQQRIDTAGIGDRVRLRGITTEMERVLSEASIYAMSSRFEGLPMILLEAMSKGVPPVSFDCPEGPRQLIDDGRTGRLVPLADVPALTAALAALMDDRDLRRRLGEEAMGTAREYALGPVVDRWEALFDEVSEPARGPARWLRRRRTSD